MYIQQMQNKLEKVSGHLIKMCINNENNAIVSLNVTNSQQS